MLSHNGVNCATDYIEVKLNILTLYAISKQDKFNAKLLVKVLFEDKFYNFKGQFDSTRPIVRTDIERFK